MQINIVLPSFRVRPGQFSVVDETGLLVLGPVACLGKADGATAALHGNPSRDPTLPFGDTSTGTYGVVELVVHTSGETSLHTYGVHPSILLDPLSGEALVAKNQGGPA